MSHTTVLIFKSVVMTETIGTSKYAQWQVMGRGGCASPHQDSTEIERRCPTLATIKQYLSYKLVDYLFYHLYYRTVRIHLPMIEKNINLLLSFYNSTSHIPSYNNL